MSGKSKKMIHAELMAQFEQIFSCPICSSTMEVVHFNRLLCHNKHSFDLSKQGYVNLLSRPHTTNYDKKLFESRKLIIENGFFEPLSTRISDMICDKKINDHTIKILDAGSGEGSHLSSIVEKVDARTENGLLGVGIDISKEGIYIAAREHTNAIWCVADISRCPFADKQFNYILNIFSPSNYAEFDRLLHDDGLLIKVMPESSYLKELRDVFYNETEKEMYSNEHTLERFGESFDVIKRERLCYSVNLDHSLVEPLIRMTPLSWGTSEERLQQVLGMGLSEVTIDLTILIGKKKQPTEDRQGV